MPDFERRRVLVAGASRGIGEQIALAAAHALPITDGEEPIDYGFEPSDVALTYVGYQDRGIKVLEAIRKSGRAAMLFQMDITDPVSVVKAMERVGSWAPKLSAAAFNIAGGLENNAQDHIFSEDINHYGQLTLLGAVKPYLADNAVIAYSQSHWGKLVGQAEEAPFEGYTKFVAEPKNRGERALRERVARMGDRGIRFTVVTGGPVKDTPVGRRGIRNYPEWAQRQEAAGNIITTREMGLAIARAMANPDGDTEVVVGTPIERYLELFGIEDDEDAYVVEWGPEQVAALETELKEFPDGRTEE